MIVATRGKLRGKELRPVQEIAVSKITQAIRMGKKYIAVRGPTGIGKTCIGFESMPIPFYYVCSSKQLQEQVVNDYPESALLMGRNNYPCDRYGTADLCLEKKPCTDCQYNHAFHRAEIARIAIFNFHYLLYILNYGKTFSGKNIIIDEADDLENVMVDFISIDFVLDNLIWMGVGSDMPSKKTKIEAVEKWINEKLPLVSMLIEGLDPIIEEIKRNCRLRPIFSEESLIVKRYKSLNVFKWKLSVLINEDIKNNWIYRHEERREAISLKPIWLGRNLMNRFLFSKVEKIIFMSATLPSKEIFCGLYGFEPEEVEYIDLPNVWESDKRPIKYRPRYNLTRKNREDVKEKVVNAIKEVMDEEPGRGLIHTVNYGITNLIKGISDRIITHTNGNKDKMFRTFLKKEGAVWVSPSSIRGLNLPYDKCEWIIWAKAPYLDLSDPQVNARVYGSGRFGRMWYRSITAQNIIQGCGRGFRYEDDYCRVYILDEQIGKILKENASLFSLWFRELIVYE